MEEGMPLNLEIQMETNRTWGDLYPGRARLADGFLVARLRRLRGKGLVAKLDNRKRWEVEVDAEGGGILVLSGLVGTNEVTTAYRPKMAASESA
jgi:hypothetical protein